MKKLILITSVLCFLAAPAVYAEEPTEVSAEYCSNTTEPTIIAKGQTLRIQNAQGEDLHVYNIIGVEVFTAPVDSADKTFNLNLKRGCYIVKVGKTARKITVE